MIVSDPSGSHGHADHIQLAGNPGGAANITRNEGGNAGFIQISGGDYTLTEGGTIYLNGNNSTESGSPPGPYKRRLVFPHLHSKCFDYTQSTVLFQLNNAACITAFPTAYLFFTCNRWVQQYNGHCIFDIWLCSHFQWRRIRSHIPAIFRWRRGNDMVCSDYQYGTNKIQRLFCQFCISLDIHPAGNSSCWGYILDIGNEHRIICDSSECWTINPHGE